MPHFCKSGLTSFVVFAVTFATAVDAAEPSVSIRADFPGGNILVVKNEGSSVQLAPDLRGGDPWFYWHFEAAASAPGKATFTFAGSPIIGVNGPAVSLDDGKSWKWLGVENVRFADRTKPRAEQSESFDFEFSPDRLKARFAVAIPYLPADLEAFLATLEGRPEYARSTLTKTRGGKPVDLLEIGRAGEGRRAMLLTARHHACESMASFVLEGFVRAALSDSPAGRAFREKYVLLVVPMVDKDGVAAGDQGKNRSPHDHNRDYGNSPIYPEIAAIQSLARARDIRYTLDLHCPALRGDIHEVFHFLGLSLPRVKNNIDEFIGRIREERPQSLNAPLNFMVDSKKPGAINRRIGSHYFATSEGNVVSGTLEIPYAVPKHSYNADAVRAYGEALLRAWVATTFVPDETTERGPRESYADLVALRTEFARTFRGRPEVVLKTIDELPQTAPWRVEAHNMRTTVYLRQKQWSEAESQCDAALADPEATTTQTIAARLLKLRIAAANPESSGELVNRRLNTVLETAYLGRDQQAQALAAAGEFFATQSQWQAAIDLAKRQIEVAAPYERGRLWLRIATFHDAAGNPVAGEGARRTAVEVLQEQLMSGPPRSVFGAAMVVDLFDALVAIPSATMDQRQAAAKQALEHPIVPQAQKQRIRQMMGEAGESR